MGTTLYDVVEEAAVTGREYRSDSSRVSSGLAVSGGLASPYEEGTLSRTARAEKSRLEACLRVVLSR